MKKKYTLLRRIIKFFLITLIFLSVLTICAFYYFKLPKQKIPDTFKGIEVAHRGGWEYGIENTIPTMRKTIATGCTALEMDVQLTKDGHMIVIHDMTLDRTTTGKGKVHDFTLAEIKQLHIKDETGKITNLQVPTLAEVLDSIPNQIIIELDIKANNMDLINNPESERVAFVIDSLSSKHDVQKLFASSFYPQYLYAIGKKNPSIFIVHSFINKKTNREVKMTSGFNEFVATSRFLLAFLGVGMVDAEYNNLSEKKIAYFTNKGIVINAWTVNNKEHKSRLKQRGISVTTNCPNGHCKDKEDPFGR